MSVGDKVSALLEPLSDYVGPGIAGNSEQCALSIAISLKRLADIAERVFPPLTPRKPLPCEDENGNPCGKPDCPHCEVPF